MPEDNTKPPDSKAPDPIAEKEAELWTILKRRRAGRLLILGYIVLAVVSWLVGEYEVINKLIGFFKPFTTYATPDEITCLNEWVLKLAGENSQAAAEQTRGKFLENYKVFGHVNQTKHEPIWENDVHVVRDPAHAGEWLVVIDMYPGASTRECMVSGKAEMVDVLDNKPEAEKRDWENRIGRLLRPAEPLCYDFSEFESTNGKVLNTGSDIQYQRSLGSCASKLQKPPGVSCAQQY